nr:vesicle transport protein SFT2B [Ipomoea batatas]
MVMMMTTTIKYCSSLIKETREQLQARSEKDGIRETHYGSIKAGQPSPCSQFREARKGIGLRTTGRRSRNQSARELTMWKSILGEDEEQQDNFFDDQEGLCAISPLQVAIAIQRLSFEIPYFISEDSILA